MGLCNPGQGPALLPVPSLASSAQSCLLPGWCPRSSPPVRGAIQSTSLQKTHKPAASSSEAKQQLHHHHHPSWPAAKAPGPALPGSPLHPGSVHRRGLAHSPGVFCRRFSRGFQNSFEAAKLGEQLQIFCLHSFLLSAF